jgi:hypothetical protein
MVELHVHSLTRFHGVVLNSLSTGQLYRFLLLFSRQKLNVWHIDFMVLENEQIRG